MKISEIFNLNKTQHELDFVDIDPNRDKPVFIDPFFLSTRNHPWCLDASRTIRNFFQYAIDLIKADEIEEARSVFIHLNEPNETCLGMSRSIPQARPTSASATAASAAPAGRRAACSAGGVTAAAPSCM